MAGNQYRSLASDIIIRIIRLIAIRSRVIQVLRNKIYGVPQKIVVKNKRKRYKLVQHQNLGKTYCSTK